jgi:hypothetical protein
MAAQFGVVSIVAGMVLFAIGCWNVAFATAAIVNYWTTFWIGVLVAFLALWAALYRPEPTSPS